MKYVVLILACTAVLSAVPFSLAQEAAKAPIYQPQGAPADPKVPAQWNRYHDHAAATKLLQALAQQHPDLCKLQSLGKSYGGREMWVLTVTNFKSGDHTDKPAFWIDGCIHANEIQASEVVLYTAWYLAETFGRQEYVTRLLNERAFYLMPIMSPDSRDAHMNEANTTHSPRTGQRPFDDDRDGLVNEDPAEDLNGDGNITQMRVRDPHGRHKPHPDYPHLMIEAKPDEKGEFTMLGTEGIDNDGDGEVNEDGAGYYDPNRDWAWSWQPKYVQYGAGHYPFSILENRMVADFIAAHPNIAGAQSYHNTGGMILRGPGNRSERYEAADTAVHVEIAKRGEQMLPGYRSLDTGRELYEVFGGETDWLFNFQGIFCFTNELWTAHNFFHKSSEGGSYFGKAEDQQLFNKYLLFGEGVVPWQEIDHPQYGRIEVGGLQKNWVRQPPSFMLEEECHRNMAFTLYHADQMPQVKVSDVKIEPLAGGLSQITATIVNEKLTPTHAVSDVKRKVTPPNIASIEGPNVKVLAGLQSDDMHLENAQEQKRHPERIKIASVKSMEPVYVRWIVSGEGPITVTIRSPKGGTNRREAAIQR